MRIMTQASFPTAPTKDALERGEVLSPRFDASGLMPVITTHAENGEVLMLGYMNAEALARTLELGEVVYFSRSRNEIWHKGATSGQIQKVVEMRVDCDQDCILVKVLPQGDGGACHVGFRSCFYRAVEDGKLVERS